MAAPQPPKKGAKLPVYAVLTAAAQTPLGVVKWHGAWRQYAFFPYAETLYEPTCLRELAAFVESCTQLYRDVRAGRKSACCGVAFSFLQVSGTRLVREIDGKRYAQAKCTRCGAGAEVRA